MTKIQYSNVNQEDVEGFPSSFVNQRIRRRKPSCIQIFLIHRRNRILSFACLFLFIWAIVPHLSGGALNFLGSTTAADPLLASKAANGMMAMAAAGRRLAITSWNIAAINNNPFEYWITFPSNPEYENIMGSIEQFLEDPGDKDVPVNQVFTDDMFRSLEAKMESVGWPSVRSYWDEDFRNRKIVSQFMKDKELGSKRLASMPDRVTNTINVLGQSDPVCRPTVINMYAGDLSSMSQWWNSWEKFMFTDPLTIRSKEGEQSLIPYQMLKPIKKSKYPAITEVEEKVSLPLQTMCGAIFDAILVHMMNTVSSPDIWQPLKRTMVENLNKQKTPHTLKILYEVYSDSDIITLQEVSSAFIEETRNGPLGAKFWVMGPENLDATRDQNSVIMLNRQTFPSGAKMEVTTAIESAFPKGVDVPVAQGDINAVIADDKDGIPYIIVSFHGDTNGLATIPVMEAVHKAMLSDPTLAAHKLIFGLDANTYEHAKKGKQQDVMEWGEAYQAMGFSSCWGDVPQKGNYTTYNARTYLQPQLNKACKQNEKRAKGDVNPKDFIVFGKDDFNVVHTWKDNTGEKKYIEDMAFPTLNFPSDHGILATIIEPKGVDSKTV